MKLKSLLVVLLAGVALSGCHRMDPIRPRPSARRSSRKCYGPARTWAGCSADACPSTRRSSVPDRRSCTNWPTSPGSTSPVPRPAREGEDTRAKDEVWQRQQEFKAATQVFIDAMNRLQDNTRQATPTPDGVRKDFAAVEDACEACHRSSARSEAGPGVIRRAWKARVGRMSAGAHSPLRQRWAAPGVPLRRGWRITPWASYALRGRREA